MTNTKMIETQGPERSWAALRLWPPLWPPPPFWGPGGPRTARPQKGQYPDFGPPIGASDICPLRSLLKAQYDSCPLMAVRRGAGDPGGRKSGVLALCQNPCIFSGPRHGPYRARTRPVQGPLEKTTRPAFFDIPKLGGLSSFLFDIKECGPCAFFPMGRVRAVYGPCTSPVRALRKHGDSGQERRFRPLRRPSDHNSGHI